MTRQHKKTITSTSRQQGFSLVELMVAGLLGLMVILSVSGIFLASRKTMNSTDAVGRIQEMSRASFDLMSRDIREAGGNPCSSIIPVGNVLRSRTSTYWTQWGNGLTGYAAGSTTPGTSTGTNTGDRIANTEAIDVYAAFLNESNISQIMSSSTANIQAARGNFVSGDILLACDTSTAFIFQATSVGSNGTSIQHNDSGGTPGNCARVFSYDFTCNNSATGYLFKTDGMVARVSAYRWYIGRNQDGGRSLFRARLEHRSTANNPTVAETMEVAPGVNDMTITYLQRGATNYVDAGSVTDWKEVLNVRVQLSFQTALASRERLLGGDGQTLQRNSTQTIALRNRAP